MIPKINRKNVGLSIILLLIVDYIMGVGIIPKITTEYQLGVYFSFCVIISILYTLWFFGKIGKG